MKRIVVNAPSAEVALDVVEREIARQSVPARVVRAVAAPFDQQVADSRVAISTVQRSPAEPRRTFWVSVIVDRPA